MAVRVGIILERKGTDVVTIGPDASLADAAALLSEHGIGAVVVSSDGRGVEGILSERDIVRHIAASGGGALQTAVRDAMTRQVTTCRRDTDTDALMSTMTNSRIRHVPVLEDDQLAGIISIGDVVKSRIDELEIQTESLKEYVTGSGY